MSVPDCLNEGTPTMYETVQHFMTPSVHTIGLRQPLVEAHHLMNRYAIRHLPVLEGGKLVGMLTQRDLHLIETLRDVDPKEVTVEEAMTQDVYTVAPDESLGAAAQVMAEHRYGSAVVMEGREVLGIFTTVDALRALANMLDRVPPKKRGRAVKTSLGRVTRKLAPVTSRPLPSGGGRKRGTTQRRR